MTSKHESKLHGMVGVSPLVLLLGLMVLVGSGCGQGNSSTESVNGAPTVPTMKSERELLLEIEKKFENPEAHYELARYYQQAREYSKAEQFANAYINQASGSGSTRTRLNLGWAFENLGLSDYALRCFQQALAKAPDSYEANKQMGLYYLGKGDNDRAREYLGRSFELNPRQPDVAGELGRLGVVVEAPKPEPEPEKDAAKK